MMRLGKQDYDAIKDTVGMRQVAEYYGCRIDRRGNCICPFHDDRRPSMKIYPHNRGYYCFACGSGGDVIKFVASLYDLSNENAARKLIDDLSLPIKIEDLSYRERRERDRKKKAQESARAAARYFTGILNLYYSYLREASKSPQDLHFAEALQMMSIVEYRLECLAKYPRETLADKMVVKWIGAVEQQLIDWDTGTQERPAIPG